jgi:UDP-glucose 4-epimerase
MRVLVTGGAGYIGRAVVEALLANGHLVVAYDRLPNFSSPLGTRIAIGDISDRHTFERTLITEGIETVIHMAAHALVAESCEDPAKYYQNNVVGGLMMLQAMRAQGVSRIVLSSTAAVYGEVSTQPITEAQPLQPSNPYGESKLVLERALHWYEQAYQFKHVSLRYFNAAGATEFSGELHNPETHLIPIVLEVAAGKRKHVDVFGNDYPTKDGTCVRDYVHVGDLAQAHVLALDFVQHSSGVFNLGSGWGYTIFEVIEAARKVTGCSIPVRVVGRRPGDPAVLIASPERAKNILEWKPRHPQIEMIIASAWEFMCRQEKLRRAASGN